MDRPLPSLTRRELVLAAALVPFSDHAEPAPNALLLEHTGAVALGDSKPFEFRVGYGVVHFGAAHDCEPIKNLAYGSEELSCTQASDLHGLAATSNVLFVTGQARTRTDARVRDTLIARVRRPDPIVVNMSDATRSFAVGITDAQVAADIVRASVQQWIAFDLEDLRSLAQTGIRGAAVAIAAGPDGALTATRRAVEGSARHSHREAAEAMLLVLAFGTSNGFLRHSKHAFNIARRAVGAACPACHAIYAICVDSGLDAGHVRATVLIA